MESVMQRSSWDGHLLLVHDNEQQRRAGVAAWVRRGLQVGAKVFYIEPVDVLPDRSLLGVLKAEQVCTDAAVDRGQVQVLPAERETFSAAFMERAIDDALAAGYPTVRWSGEAETAWGVISRAAHADLEWATDELCHRSPVSVLCQYSAGMTQATLQTVCAMHGDGVRESLLHTSPLPGGIAIAGEVDVSNEAILRSSLLAARSAGVGRGLFVVDLRRLDFLDVAGARALLAATSAHRSNGGKVLLRAAQPQVDRILRLLGLHQAPGSVLEGAR
jgi:anti-anti-sigma factor